MADREYFGFVWDDKKDKANQRKHKLDFETAVRIFNDPFLYTEYDVINSQESGEHRERNIGTLSGVLLLTVSTTDRDGKIRVFSARKATHKEVKIYEQNAKKLQGH